MKSQLKQLSLIHVEFHVLIGLPDYFKHKLHDFTGFNLFVSILSIWVLYDCVLKLLNDLVNNTSCCVCGLSGIPALFTLKIRFRGARIF